VTQIAFIGSPTAIQQEGAAFSTNPVGAGPFVFKSWTRDSQFVMTRNPNYWDAPRPYLDQIIIKVIVDESQRMNTFFSGAANYMFIGTPSNAVQAQKNGGVSYPTLLNAGLLLYFNVTKPPFTDLRARQAIAMAIDPKDYAKVVDQGTVEPLDSVFVHTSPFYDPTITQTPYNPTGAQQLFDQLAQEKGGPLTFDMTTFPAQNYVDGATYVQGILNGYRNVKVNLSIEASTQHISSCTQRLYVGVCFYGGPFDDPEPLWTSIFTCSAGTNYTGFCDAKFDADVLDNQTTVDPARRIADIKDAQRIIYAQVPVLYLDRRQSWDFATPQLQNIHIVNDGLTLINQVWLKTH
jgi:peptide/nickel transport system substrate-binding protein